MKETVSKENPRQFYCWLERMLESEQSQSKDQYRKGNMVESPFKNYRQFEFITDMGMAYACADLVISRAGAGTIFELLALKKPSLLIPLEGPTRGDQVENAAYFQAKGLCHVLKQSHLFTLPQAIEEAFIDEKMKELLRENTFQSGNECILNELKKVLQ